jgi:hypothetical protein
MTLSPTDPARHTTPPDGVAGSGPVEPFGMAPVTRAPDAATSPRIRVRGTHSSVQPASTVAGRTAREEDRPAGKGKAGRTVPLAQAPAGGAAKHATALLAGQARIAAAMSEDRGPDSLEAHVRKLMDDLGLWGHHQRNSVGSRRGWPDWTILGDGAGLFRELKSERGKVSAEQRHVGAMLRCAGFDWDVWRPSDLLSGRIVRELTAISRIGQRTPRGAA